jgi:serine/threonine protein kinase
MASVIAETLAASPELAKTCVLDGSAVADLLRDAVAALANKEETDVVLARILEAIPTVLISHDHKVGAKSVYELRDRTLIIRRSHLISGGYNRIFRADYKSERGVVPAVLRVVKHGLSGLDTGDTITLSFVENLIHILVHAACPHAIVPLICPITLPRKGPPKFDFGSLVERVRGGTDLYSLMKNQKEIDDCLDASVMFEVSRNLFKLLAELQAKCKFVHRDLKEDNVMVLKDLSVQLIDFGCAELEVGGERIACDCEDYLRGNTFNDSVDVVYYCLSLYDSSWGFKEDTPEFYKFIRSVAGPAYAYICKKYPGHAKQSGDSRIENTMKVIYEYVKPGTCTPQMALDKLESCIRKRKR